MAERLWVLDTSVVAAWFFTDEPQREEALEVRASLCDEPHRFVVPPLFYSELVHVLARKSGRDRIFMEQALHIILALGLRTVSLAEAALVRVVHWSCAGLSGCDATFVALAEDLGARWLTADERALKVVGRGAGKSLATWSTRR